jgi:hypothetical protein
MVSELVPPEQEELCVDVLRPKQARMLYVTRISHRMQKHKLVVTCTSALFMEIALGPPENEK